MFKGNKDNKPQSISTATPSKLDTLLGQNTKLNGDISFNGVFHLDGTVAGSLIGTQKEDILTISETGLVEGKIEVANIVINGTVKGDITSIGKIEVASKANIEGNVFYNNIEMEAGSKINGQLIYQDKDATGNITKLEDKKSKKD